MIWTNVNRKRIDPYMQSYSCLTTNGFEPNWREYTQGYASHTNGSNCYSYAINDFRINGDRPNKSVPGDISKWVYDRIQQKPRQRRTTEEIRFAAAHETHPFSPNHNWKTCGDTRLRLLRDGMAAALIHTYLGRPIRWSTTILDSTTNAATVLSKNIPMQHADTRRKAKNSESQIMVARRLHTKAPKFYRKIFMVVDSHAGMMDFSTDFHFYTQYQVRAKQLYNLPIEVKSWTKHKVDVFNPYVILGVNAFVTQRQLRNKIRQGKNTGRANMRSNDTVNASLYRRAPRDIERASVQLSITRICPENGGLSDAKLNRAMTNARLHVAMLPVYCLNFIPDPTWLLGYHQTSLIEPEELRKRKKELLRTTQTLPMYPGETNHEHEQRKKHIRVVIETATSDIFSWLNGQTKFLDPKTQLGLWAHKAGWATKGMNADGDKKLIFDPNLCNRDHGSSYDYDTPCGVFYVLKGRGITSVPTVLAATGARKM